MTLANLDPANLVIAEKLAAPKDAISLVVNTVEIFIPFGTLEDSSADPARAQKEIETLQSQINRLEGLLASDFANKAPAAGGGEGTRQAGGIQGIAAEIEKVE